MLKFKRLELLLPPRMGLRLLRNKDPLWPRLFTAAAQEEHSEPTWLCLSVSETATRGQEWQCSSPLSAISQHERCISFIAYSSRSVWFLLQVFLGSLLTIQEWLAEVQWQYPNKRGWLEWIHLRQLYLSISMAVLSVISMSSCMVVRDREGRGASACKGSLAC